MEKEKSRAFALLFLTFFVWASVYVGAKLISGDIPPSLLACLRTCSGAACVSLMAWQYRHIHIERKDLWLLLLVGFLGYYATVNLVQIGIALTGASVAALINALTPVSVTLLAALILHEKITPVKVVCLALALAGTVIITGGTQSRGELMGIFAMLGAVTTWGFASVYLRKLTAKYPPVLVTAYGLCISLLFHIPTGIASLAAQGAVFTPFNILVILYLGIAGTGISQYTWSKSLSILPASTCSLFYPLQAMFSALLGAMILKEHFHSSFFLGFALICMDVALNTWGSRRENAA